MLSEARSECPGYYLQHKKESTVIISSRPQISERLSSLCRWNSLALHFISFTFQTPNGR